MEILCSWSENIKTAQADKMWTIGDVDPTMGSISIDQKVELTIQPYVTDWPKDISPSEVCNSAW